MSIKRTKLLPFIPNGDAPEGIIIHAAVRADLNNDLFLFEINQTAGRVPLTGAGEYVFITPIFVFKDKETGKLRYTINRQVQGLDSMYELIPVA